ncbi:MULTISPECIES: sensor domain-containing diguanylate cyclase [unclassified Pseudomonas]|uniref:sensor domain-containing diguanylate cyclase n=1 Tax=unclassified Pseudomonas TaxID=196821 RepID=UPI002AC8CF95|nr:MULTISPECIES: sensor domain-containing diguanylate cyclase [unclassified Pseudomonas]MEB0048495.1 sensor domain-containing diguanylate cyclase [Pseudomonas sp. Dout3]MEB0099358.1 sensor domain-containing diguanylate cyclase [Pseudomonas sp. DC1.2]WPX61172.1 sensor domain-containing diguanylate cyclase [Pseudomonas sp. DC1.2]
MSSVDTDSDVYKTLLESTRAIPWRIDWKTMTFSYIGPQIEQLLGWEQDSWASVDDWVERMHPDDRAYVVEFCVSQSRAGVDHEADYRALTRNGDYVWIRDVVHVVRKDGEVEALVGFMFDISERKKTEEHLTRLQKQLEEYSFQDGLTGIANRRMFDTVLEREWANAQRTGLPLSLLILDIDYFKQYNDHYGHIKGDECLRRVAQTLSLAANRPRDFIARIGGEEFIWLLPESDAESARLVARKCLHLICQQQIPHPSSSVSALVSLSLGVGTIAVTQDSTALEFVEQVDKLLYQAKHNGRMRAEFADLRD